MSTKYQIGEQVKVVRNVGSHSYQIGAIVTVCSVGPTDAEGFQAKSANGVVGNWLRDSEVEPVVVKTDKEKIEDELAKQEAAVALSKAKLAYLADTGVETFDSQEFKCYQALGIVESAVTKHEKAKALAELLKNK